MFGPTPNFSKLTIEKGDPQTDIVINEILFTLEDWKKGLLTEQELGREFIKIAERNNESEKDKRRTGKN